MRPHLSAYRLAAILILALVCWQMPVRAKAAETKAAENWDLYIYNPVATVAAVKGINVIIEQIEQQTNGELKIRLHYFLLVWSQAV
jgi:hypothetical protein